MNRVSLEIYKFLSRWEEVIDRDWLSDPDELAEHVRDAVLRSRTEGFSRLFDTIFDYGFLNIDWKTIADQLSQDIESSDEEEEEEAQEDDDSESEEPSLASKLVEALSREHS